VRSSGKVGIWAAGPSPGQEAAGGIAGGPYRGFEPGLPPGGPGEIGQAIVAVERAVRSRPRDARACNDLGQGHLLRGDLARAEQSFRLAVVYDKRYADPWYGLANVFLELGRERDAVHALRVCLRRDLGHPKAGDALTALAPEVARWVLQGAPPIIPTAGEVRGVFVAGMHRSGTSFIVRALDLCGLDLGVRAYAESLRGGQSVSNARGHWEDPYFLTLNKLLLTANGGSWDRVPDEMDLELSKDLIQGMCEGMCGRVWGFKDPRVSITYPVYHRWFPGFVIVAGLRHPLSVAQSLARRNGFEIRKGLDLWSAYNRRLLRWAREYGVSLFFVEFPSCRGLKGVLDALGLEYDPDAVEGWLDPNLIHADPNAETPAEYLDLYQHLLSLVDAGGGSSMPLASRATSAEVQSPGANVPGQRRRLGQALVEGTDGAGIWYRAGIELLRQGRVDDAVEAWLRFLASKSPGAGSGGGPYRPPQAQCAVGAEGPGHADREPAAGASAAAEAAGSYARLVAQAARRAAAGDEAGAARLYGEAVALDPRQPGGYYELGLLHHQRGEIPEALACFERVSELTPRDTTVWNNLGALSYAQRQWAVAERSFRLAAGLDETYVEAWYGLGKTLLKQGREREATGVLETCLFLDSQHQKARKALDGLRGTAMLQSLRGARIGFVSVWFERGQAYVTKTLRDALARDNETFILARTGLIYGQPALETQGFWAVPNLTTYPEYQIPPAALVDWIKDKGLDAVVFNEEYDWDLVQAARAAGVKVLTYLDYYKDDWKPLMRLYDAVLCSTRRTYDLVKDVCRAHHIGWAVDSQLFRPDGGAPPDGPESKMRQSRLLGSSRGGKYPGIPGHKYTFFHNAGWLGLNYRKMTPGVILAFDAVAKKLPDVTLLVHAQTGLERLPPGIARIVRENPRITYHVETLPAPGLYHLGRILVFPSKLEGLGLPLFEGLACGLPVIATDAPPMNEFVQDGYNGLLVKVAHTETRDDNIAFPENIVDLNHLAQRMFELGSDEARVKELGSNARRYAEEQLSMRGLSERVGGVISGVLSGSRGPRRSRPEAAGAAGKPAVTICTVAFDSKTQVHLNWALTTSLNSPDRFVWLVVENSEAGPDRLSSLDRRLVVVQGVPPPSADQAPWARGSYHHGAALNKALDYIGTRFALFLDPDFYLVRPGWIDEVLGYMLREGLALFGVPWHPRWHLKYRYFPSAHCLFVDLDKIPVKSLDFTPQFRRDGGGMMAARSEELTRYLPEIERCLSDRFDRDALVLRDLGRRALIGSSRDTGYALFQRYGHGGVVGYECAVPVFRPESDLQRPGEALSEAGRAIEAVLPDHLCYLPKRPGYYSERGFRDLGLPDLAGLGWEEFLWQGRPFGFHLRRAAANGHDPDEEMASLTRTVARFASGGCKQ